MRWPALLIAGTLLFAGCSDDDTADSGPDDGAYAPEEVPNTELPGNAVEYQIRGFTDVMTFCIDGGHRIVIADGGEDRFEIIEDDPSCGENQ